MVGFPNFLIYNILSGRINEGGELSTARDPVLHLERKGYQNGVQMLRKLIQEIITNVLNTVPVVTHSKSVKEYF
jgi:hypothetical protein